LNKGGIEGGSKKPFQKSTIDNKKYNSRPADETVEPEEEFAMAEPIRTQEFPIFVGNAKKLLSLSILEY